MRRVIQCSAAVFTVVCASFAIAGGYDYTKEDMNGYTLQPDFKVSDDGDYSRNGHAFYFFGGYVYADRFLSSKTVYVTNSNNTISYIPKDVLPSTFNGFSFGFGKEWTRNIDFQLSYYQHFSASRSGTTVGLPFTTTVKTNGLLADIGYVINPDDQFQMMIKLGAAVTEFYDKLTINNVTYYPADDLTKIDPAAGVEFYAQFSKHVGFRLSTTYIADTQTNLSNGEVNAMAGFSYTL